VEKILRGIEELSQKLQINNQPSVAVGVIIIPMPKIRLQKYCSEKGIASRRKAEEYIINGWIKVNGQVVTELGTKIDPANDKVELTTEAKQEKANFQYVMLHKPTGYVTNLPNKGEKEARDLLPPKFKHLNPVGRLDKESEGLLLFTNDGVVAHRLTSPKFDHEKEYEVLVDKEISQEVIEKYREGVVILGEITRPARVELIRGKTYRFVLSEGKNRQIRRMMKNFDYNVYRLKRVRIFHLRLGQLKMGCCRELTEIERARLLS